MPENVFSLIYNKKNTTEELVNIWNADDYRIKMCILAGKCSHVLYSNH